MARLEIHRRDFLRSSSAALAATTLIAAAPGRVATTAQISVSAAQAQTFEGFGLSQPLYDNFATLDAKVQSKALEFVYGSLPVDYFRAWLASGAGMDRPKMLSQFRKSYLDNRLLARVSEYSQPKLILAPDIGGEAYSSEPSAYASKIAEFLATLRSQEGLVFEATGVVNEPSADPASTSYLAAAASSLRRELDNRNLRDTKIVAADWANASYKSVEAISELEADAEANAAIHAWSNHSYNMCSTKSMEIAARNKERWITEAGQVILDSDGTPASVNAMDASNLAARFLTDLNHGVTRWMYFVGFLSTTYPKAPTNPWCALALTSPSGEITAFNRYFYLKELLRTFPRGSVFHACDSSLDGAMDWTYGQKPRLSAACAEGPDGRLRMAIVNATGIVSNTISRYYPSQAFQIELDLPWPDKMFDVFVIGIDAKIRSLGTFQSGRGQSYPSVDPFEMMTLVEA